ncbi:MAG TPA: VOC family protein [Polyangiaceae bacterium]|nr:VOC family protein [Polyangiaceae bacterium]
MSESARPFRILGVQQIAIGGLDRAPLRHLWCDLLGVAAHGSYQSVAENVVEDLLSVGPPDAPVEIDLMQPLDATRAPRVHEPALNHIGLWVDDLPAAYAWLEARGVRFAPGGVRPGAAGHDVCFIHPKPSADKPESGQGVLIELVQAPPDVVTRLSAR